MFLLCKFICICPIVSQIFLFDNFPFLLNNGLLDPYLDDDKNKQNQDKETRCRVDIFQNMGNIIKAESGQKANWDKCNQPDKNRRQVVTYKVLKGHTGLTDIHNYHHPGADDKFRQDKSQEMAPPANATDGLGNGGNGIGGITMVYNFTYRPGPAQQKPQGVRREDPQRAEQKKRQQGKNVLRR